MAKKTKLDVLVENKIDWFIVGKRRSDISFSDLQKAMGGVSKGKVASIMTAVTSAPEEERLSVLKKKLKVSELDGLIELLKEKGERPRGDAKIPYTAGGNRKKRGTYKKKSDEEVAQEVAEKQQEKIQSPDLLNPFQPKNKEVFEEVKRVEEQQEHKQTQDLIKPFDSELEEKNFEKTSETPKKPTIPAYNAIKEEKSFLQADEEKVYEYLRKAHIDGQITGNTLYNSFEVGNDIAMYLDKRYGKNFRELRVSGHAEEYLKQYVRDTMRSGRFVVGSWK